MALSSSSSAQDAKDQYNDNLDWDGDIVKAQLALAAVRYLIMNVPQRFEADSGREHEYKGWIEERKKLEPFVSRNKTTVNSIRLADVSGS